MIAWQHNGATACKPSRRSRHWLPGWGGSISMRSEEHFEHLAMLAFRFFYRYSRFEFALKENGYLKAAEVSPVS